MILTDNTGLFEAMPEVAESRALNVATNKLSQLNKKGKIKADKNGKRYRYYI